MKKRIIFLGLSLMTIMMVSSCSKAEWFEGTPSKQNISNTKEGDSRLRSEGKKILTVQELRQHLLSKYSRNNIQPNTAEVDQYGNIGYGYDFFLTVNENEYKAEVILESDANVRLKVLNVTDATQNRINIKSANSQGASEQVFQEFEKELPGFFSSKIDLKEFGVPSIFNCSWLKKGILAYKNSIRKELKLSDYPSKNVFIQTESRISKKRISYNLGSMKRFIPERDLESDFYINYHLQSPQNLINDYGSFILTDYNSGGKVVTTVGYTSKENKSSEVLRREGTKMARFSNTWLFKKNHNNTGYHSPEAVQDYKSTINDYENGHMKISHAGGGYFLEYPEDIDFSILKSSNFPYISLKDWANSIDNTQALLSINTRGLTPIFKVIKEKNIAEQVKHYMITGEDTHIDENKIKYELYYHKGIVTLVMYSMRGDVFILNKEKLPLIGFEWWIQGGLAASPIPIHIETPTKNIVGPPPTTGVIDLSSYFSAHYDSDIDVKICKVESDIYDSDVISYLVVHNKETGKKIAISFPDEYGFSKYGFIRPQNIEYVKHLSYIDMYGI